MDELLRRQQPLSYHEFTTTPSLSLELYNQIHQEIEKIKSENDQLDIDIQRNGGEGIDDGDGTTFTMTPLQKREYNNKKLVTLLNQQSGQLSLLNECTFLDTNKANQKENRVLGDQCDILSLQQLEPLITKEYSLLKKRVMEKCQKKRQQQDIRTPRISSDFIKSLESKETIQRVNEIIDSHYPLKPIVNNNHSNQNNTNSNNNNSNTNYNNQNNQSNYNGSTNNNNSYSNNYNNHNSVNDNSFNNPSPPQQYQNNNINQNINNKRTNTTTTPSNTSNYNNYNSNNNNYNQNNNNNSNNNKKKVGFSKASAMEIDDQDDIIEEDRVETEFKTAKEGIDKNKLNSLKKSAPASAPPPPTKNISTTKTLGGKRKGFKSPYKEDEDNLEGIDPTPVKKQTTTASKPTTNKQNSNTGGGDQKSKKDDETNPGGITNVNGVPLDDERIRNIEPRLLEVICNEILDNKKRITWKDIAGLEEIKKEIKEMATFPLLRPDLFRGLKNPPKGLLLFGPPGTGKTMIGKAISCEVNATFFSISASIITSKWIGEGEKMVRALFAVARCHLPSVIFIDEIDSLLTQRSDGENDASRRIKTEFLIQWDGVSANSSDRMLLIGATNRPEELDEAARRRLSKRLLIPLPEYKSRLELVRTLLREEHHILTEEDLETVANLTQGYSGSDISDVCREAAYSTIRDVDNIETISANDVRPINIRDFENAVKRCKSTVDPKELKSYEDWNLKFGGNM